MLNTYRLVELEIHGHCNRKCAWCPNIELQRTRMTRMPEEVYLKILKELKEGGFKGAISFSRYNEPMADSKLFKKRVEQAKAILPGVKLVSNTNGDFFSSRNIDGLCLDELSIMDYDCIGLKACRDRLRQADADIEKIEYPYIIARYKGIGILYYIDWPLNAALVDRGGFFKSDIEISGQKLNWADNKSLRTRPCLEPLCFIGIDYNGDVVPCCQIRGDNPEHKAFILGNVTRNKLIDICTGEIAEYFKTIPAGSDFSKYPEPCKYCRKSPGRYTRENPGISF